MMKHGAKAQLNSMSTDERSKLLETGVDKDARPNSCFCFLISQQYGH